MPAPAMITSASCERMGGRIGYGGAGVPILFLTTESDAEIKAQAKAAGATGWLTKPFDPEQLVRVVKKVLAK
jgi:DNA-binding response OmpR family regulator